ncbi:hypothetical protein SMKI_14G3440 [Saccharomyces mikatae IFO 1815]|uniref:PPIase cyclophilin-type domain-containing protein n=1 Tax=Saccharomyces mikatae IFO 1815 TaxID=226126 RepID=A0AA35IVA4_SACMI|nr:uncharacterized protein SMKI_14G3440 [Saccharomyces mikatae IFO 1815]CAI4036125.1 hypothetical protein SMKI_14G3440 [Saccharomyces mikatae IFO 1815]
MKSFFVHIYVALMFACATALPLPIENRRASSDSLDLKKKYAPNPPATHNVDLELMFTDPENSKVMRHHITIDLYGTMVPKTVTNFCRYVDSIENRITSGPIDSSERDFDKILPNGSIECDPVLPSSTEETGGLISVFEENHDLPHDRPGRVSMIGDDTGFKFIIETSGTPPEGESIVFGQVTSGLKDLIDKLANVQTNENGTPEQPITIDYISSNENKFLDPKRVHEQYLERLHDYQSGSLEKGVTLKNYLYSDNQRKVDDVKYNQLHHPLPRVMLGISVLLLFYVLAKYRKRIFSRSSSKIISIRED